MRNSKTHSVAKKKKLSKCKTIFTAYNDLQYAYGLQLEKNKDITEIRCNIQLSNCLGYEHYTTDFYCVKSDGEILVRECVYKDKLLKPMTSKMLDASRGFWLSQGITDWGIVIDAK